MSLLSSSASSLTTPPPPLTKRPDFARNSPVLGEFSRNEGPYLYVVDSPQNSSNPLMNVINHSSSSSFSSSSASIKGSFSLSNYPGPPPTVGASHIDGPLRFGEGGNGIGIVNNNINGESGAVRANASALDSAWRASLNDQLRLQQQQRQQPQQHHMDVSVKIRRKTIDVAAFSKGAAATTGDNAVANRGTPLKFGTKCPPLAPLPSASALNASLQAAAATTTTTPLIAAEATATPKNAASKKRPARKPKAIPAASAKDGLAAYEDTIVNGYAEVLFRCTQCSASTPAMFKTKRSFVMHFCSVHAKDSPQLKAIADALKTQSATKQSTAEAENNNNENNDNASPAEPPSKKRKRESGTPAGILAIAEGIKKNAELGADVGWPYSALLNAARMESSSLVKDNSSKTTLPLSTSVLQSTLNAPTPAENPLEHNSQFNEQLSGLDRPLKIELDDTCSKSSSSPPPLHLPRIESTNRRKKGMKIPIKVTSTSPSEHGENNGNNNMDQSSGSIHNDEDSYDMPPSPQPLTIISEDNNNKTSPKTALMEALLQKNGDNNPSNDTINNNDENCNNKNLNSNASNGINANAAKGAKSQARAYANALNALTGPGLSRSQLISAFSSPDAFRNFLPPPPAGATAPDGSFIKVEQSDDGLPLLPPIPSDPSSTALSLRDTLAGMPLVPGVAPSFTNDPFMDAFKTLLLLPSLSAEERLKIEKPYECDQCGRRFTRSDKVSRHKLIHSGEKPFECEICHKRFHRSDKLTVHKKIHTGERPHECDVCGKRFTRHYHLTKHRSLHTGNRPHACNVCPKKFFDRYSQLRHMKTHPENAALFAACNTPQEVIEALNAVTGFAGSSGVGGGGNGAIDGRVEGRPDAALFSPNNNPSWTKEMEALFRAAKSDSPAKGSDVGESQRDVDEDEEDDEMYDEDDTDDEMDDSIDGSSLGRKTPNPNPKKLAAAAAPAAQDRLTPNSSGFDASSLLLGLDAAPTFLPSRVLAATIKRELAENNNSTPEEHNLLNFATAAAVAAADSRSSGGRHSV